jgi:hypothetical protein
MCSTYDGSLLFSIFLETQKLVKVALSRNPWFFLYVSVANYLMENPAGITCPSWMLPLSVQHPSSQEICPECLLDLG